MNRDENRGPWYLLTGLVIGLALGLVYTWVINPVQFTDAAPSALKPAFKDAYRSLIAQAYLSNGDIGRARGRLELLKDGKIPYELGAQAQRLVSSGGSPQDARALAQLAADLERSSTLETTETSPVEVTGSPAAGQGTALPASETPQPTASSSPTLDEAEMILTPTQLPSPTATPQATFTPQAQALSQPKLNAPLVLKERKDVCDAGLPEGLLQVEISGQDGKPVSGVRIDITWNGGQDAFYTGLYPEKGAGYADFDMTPSLVYSLRAGEGGEVVSNISAKQCTGDDGKSFLGGVHLTFGN